LSGYCEGASKKAARRSITSEAAERALEFLYCWAQHNFVDIDIVWLFDGIGHATPRPGAGARAAAI